MDNLKSNGSITEPRVKHHEDKEPPPKERSQFGPGMIDRKGKI